MSDPALINPVLLFLSLDLEISSRPSTDACSRNGRRLLAQVGSSDEIMQQALDLRLENKREPTQNLLEVSGPQVLGSFPREIDAWHLALRSLTFAPLEIFMIPGLVASILGFYPDAAEAHLHIPKP